MALPQAGAIPEPRPSLHAQAYWDGCPRHELLYQRCAECSACALGAFTVCARCLASSPIWEPSSGKGSLDSWTVVWRPPEPSFRVPYAPVVVLLDEGAWILSAIIGCEPEALREGLRLRVEFHPASEEIALPYFTPVE